MYTRAYMPGQNGEYLVQLSDNLNMIMGLPYSHNISY